MLFCSALAFGIFELSRSVDRENGWSGAGLWLGGGICTVNQCNRSVVGVFSIIKFLLWLLYEHEGSISLTILLGSM